MSSGLYTGPAKDPVGLFLWWDREKSDIGNRGVYLHPNKYYLSSQASLKILFFLRHHKKSTTTNSIIVYKTSNRKLNNKGVLLFGWVLFCLCGWLCICFSVFCVLFFLVGKISYNYYYFLMS